MARPVAGDVEPSSDAESPVPDEAAPASYPSDDEISESSDGGATRALMNLLSRHPFSDLHDSWAHIPKLEGRAWLCFVLDLFFRLVVVLLVLAIIGAVAYKTLFPLPHV